MPAKDTPKKDDNESGLQAPYGLKLDADTFFEEEQRRDKIQKMQETVRRGRTTPVAIRFDQFTLRRLRTLATLHNTGYQTLLKEFVLERLYEEEKRAGIVDT